jgi:flagellar assembly factor FliW
MKLDTPLLGELEYEKEDIITFPAGLPGLEEEKEFLILAMEEGSPLYCLQSLNNTSVCLILAQPFVFFPNYSIEIGDDELRRLECETEDNELAIYVVLTIPEDFKQSTANLLAPIIINSKNKKGLQFIAAKSDYNTRHKIFPSEQCSAAAAREG